MNAKAYMHTNLTLADEYIRKTIAIDPDHCDAGLIVAQLDLALRHDVDRALLTAADTLKCKFVMQPIWTMMNQIFQMKLQARPGDAGAVEEMADILVRAGVSLMAAKSYQEAVVMYFAQQKYVDAVRVSLKAEKEIPNFILPSEDVSSQLLGVLQMSCNIFALGGSVRSQILLSHKQEKLELIQTRLSSFSFKEEVYRAKELLFLAIQPNCTHIDLSTKRLTFSQTTEAAMHLIHLLRFELHDNPSTAVALEMLKAIEFALVSIDHILELTNPSTNADYHKYIKILSELRTEGEEVALALGKRFYGLDNFINASFYFRVSSQHSKHAEHPSRCSSALYWLANSLAQVPGFALDDSQLEEAREALTNLLSCYAEKNDVSGDFAKLLYPAKESLDELNLFIYQKTELDITSASDPPRDAL